MKEKNIEQRKKNDKTSQWPLDPTAMQEKKKT